jgi:hypothetical protein
MMTQLRSRATDPGPGAALGLAAGLGLLADALFPAGPQGPGFLLWVLALGAAAALVAHRVEPSAVGAVAGWSLVAAVAAAGPVVRDSDVAFPAMWVVLFTAASMVLLRVAGVRLWKTRPADHLLGFAWLPARAALGVVPLLAELRPPPDTSRRRAVAIARGALLAVPLLLLFGALFAAADAGFDRHLGRVFAFWSEDLVEHLAIIFVFGWIAAGLLAGVRAKRLPNPLSLLRPPRIGVDETAVALGLLALLFLAFVGFQLGYLFGGRDVIEATSGLTVADYARRGFFELMAVGLATVGVLLVADALTEARRLFRWLAGILIASTLVILASAVQRLMLYTATFGLTVDRITAAVVMAWVAAVLMWFAATVLRDRPRPFASGAVIAGIVAAFALLAIDPADVAARSNLDRAAAGVREADVDFLSRLSADAVPTIVGRIDELPVGTRCEIASRMLNRWGDDPAGTQQAEGEHDWRSWNAARMAARRAVRDASPRLEAAAAGCLAGERR